MPKALKDARLEQAQFRGRAWVALSTVALCVLLLLARFAWLQLVRHEEFSTRSEQNRVKLRALAPTRGLIFDRHGVLLADNRLSYRLEVIPEQAGDLTALLNRLSGIIALSAEDRERFLNQVRYRRAFQSLPLRFNLSEDEVARLALDRWQLPGVEVVPVPSRHYPHGDLLGHLIGYVGRINAAEQEALEPSRRGVTSHVGKLGIERQYELRLRGELGREQVETNAEGRVLRVLEQEPASPGENLYLSIDLALQRAVVESFGEHRGAAVVIEVNSGEVLALVSQPGYDPNAFVNGISQADYDALLQAPGRPLFNRALQGGYEPGSTLKPFIALAGLEAGLITPEETVWSTGEFRLPGHQTGYRDHRAGGHGRVDLREAMAQSVNTYFYQLGLELGIDRMSMHLRRFGFGQTTGIDLPGEASGILPTREWKRARFDQPWYPGETVIAAIGQGYNVTTITQLSVATAALANGGRRLQPRLLRAVQPLLDQPPQAVPQLPAEAIGISDPGNLAAVVASMHAVVQGPTGTARAIGDAPYRFAGKTGTAQRTSRTREGVAGSATAARNQALFIAFAPLERPQIALALVVEAGDSGSRTAAPIARRILDAWLLRDGASLPEVSE